MRFRQGYDRRGIDLGSSLDAFDEGGSRMVASILPSSHRVARSIMLYIFQRSLGTGNYGGRVDQIALFDCITYKIKSIPSSESAWPIPSLHASQDYPRATQHPYFASTWSIRSPFSMSPSLRCAWLISVAWPTTADSNRRPRFSGPNAVVTAIPSAMIAVMIASKMSVYCYG